MVARALVVILEPSLMGYSTETLPFAMYGHELGLIRGLVTTAA